MTDIRDDDVRDDDVRDDDGRDDRWVDDLLRASLADGPHIDDAGFSDRALAGLPPRRRRPGRRDLVVGLSGLTAAACGALAFASSGGALEVSLAAARAHPTSILGAVVVVGLALWGAFATSEA